MSVFVLETLYAPQKRAPDAVEGAMVGGATNTVGTGDGARDVGGGDVVDRTVGENEVLGADDDCNVGAPGINADAPETR